MKKKDVVITQFGFVSPLGSTEEEFTQKLFAGSSGVRSLYETGLPSSFPVPYAAYIPLEEIPQTDFFADKDLSVQLKSWLLTAAAMESLLKKEAQSQSLNQSKSQSQSKSLSQLQSQTQTLSSTQVTNSAHTEVPVAKKLSLDAIIYGTADGVSFEMVYDYLKKKNKNIETQSENKNSDLQNFAWEKTRCESSLDVLHQILVKNGYPEVPEAQHICINSACATGNNAIGMALEGLQAGRWERCLVGGVDARCEPSNYLNFNSLGALTTANVPPSEASRPFSVDRSGFVRGEGAAVLLMETRESAIARGATILAQVTGFDFTSDAFRLTDGRDDGASVIKAMQSCIESAGLQPSDIQYINAHGTSTPLNDKLETIAIKKVFGEQAAQIPISSLKSQIGHSTIASSALEAIACLVMLKHQKVSPTINYKAGDPICDLDYIPNESRDLSIKNILSNSFGFGGQNSCVIFSKDQV